jgi:tRNA(fMet)-specific endonuclease VapC
LVGTTIITVEEQMRGWLATITKERKAKRQVNPYRELGLLFDFFSELHVQPFDDAAADRFDQLPARKVGTMDRKIAAIALTQNALLLTANSRDFGQIPGLRFENWMDTD